MAYINGAVEDEFAAIYLRYYDDAEPEFSDFATLTGSTWAINGTTLAVPALQDMTLSNSAGTFRWKELGSLSEKVVTTVAANSVSGNFVLDPVTFFGNDTGDNALTTGVFGISNAKRKVDFLILLNGLDLGNRAFMGSAYITGISPKISADSPVWVSSFNLEVDGDFITHIIID